MIKNTLWKTVLILACGALYYIWIRITGLAVPCIFRLITGWLCPGCGITTLFLCLTEGDFSGAYEANPFLFCTGPFLAVFIILEYHLRLTKKSTPKWLTYILVLYLFGLLLFGVLRNLV